MRLSDPLFDWLDRHIRPKHRLVVFLIIVGIGWTVIIVVAWLVLWSLYGYGA